MTNFLGIIKTWLDLKDRRDRKKAESDNKKSAVLSVQLNKNPIRKNTYNLVVSNVGLSDATNVTISLDYDKRKVIEIDLELRKNQTFTLNPSTSRCFEIWVAESGNRNLEVRIGWDDIKSNNNSTQLTLQFS